MLRKALALGLILVPGLCGTMVAWAAASFLVEAPPAIPLDILGFLLEPMKTAGHGCE
jgi:hypothetical protein